MALPPPQRAEAPLAAVPVPQFQVRCPVRCADDFVIATGESHSVREFCQVAFEHVGLDWERHVRVDPRYYRPTEVDHLCGDGSKADERMGWRPATGFQGLVRLMADADVELLADEMSGRLVRIDLPRGSPIRPSS
jgi:nucleoside-diphosphate-sugar epimerase